ncbi:YhgE/Pip domain-containing protein [Leifsonia sp. A12D58]|uniref:YhgE/Pip domain-containing protein n=1 Tax=Leifsonia sp. A12D58 TaxID=3397674 RepID=UPI0039DFFD46
MSLTPSPRRLRSRIPAPFTIVVLFALCIIPLIYASALIWSNDDPTGNFDHVPAAIVNNDTGVTLESGADGEPGQDVSLGDDVVAALMGEDGTENTGFDWTLTDAADAADGLAAGTYLAVLTVPDGFSADATSAASADPADADSATEGSLTMMTNDASNYITGNVAKALGTTLAEKLSSEVSATYLENIYLGFTTIHNSMLTASDGAADIVDGTTSLRQGATSLRTGLGTIADSVSALPDGVAQLSAGAESAAAGSVTLTDGLTQLESGSSTLADGLGTAVGGANALAGGLDQLATSTPKLASGSSQVATGLSQLSTNYSAMTDAQRTAAITQLAAAAQNVSSGAAAAGTAVGTLDTGAHSLVGSASTGTGLSALAAGAETVRDGVVSAHDGSMALSSGLGTLADGLGTLSGQVPALVEGIDQAAAGSTTLESGVDRLLTGTVSLADGLSAGVDEVPAYTDQQAQALSSAAATPIVLDAEHANAVANNGAGLTPYFMALGLWIGTLATFFMRPALNIRALDSKAPAIRVALRSYLPNAILAVIQAIAAVLIVRYAVGIEMANLPGALGIAALASLTFMAINQALIALLGAPGRFVGLLLIVLQLSSAGGTYPIQTSAPFFQTMHDVLPLTFTVQALRGQIAGSGLGTGAGVTALVIWCVGALLVTTLGVFVTRRKQSGALVNEAVALSS